MTFEELKREAQKATGRDRLGATACALIAEILNTQAQINEARAALMMAHEVAQQSEARLRRGLQFSLVLNLTGLAWLAALTLLRVAP